MAWRRKHHDDLRKIQINDDIICGPLFLALGKGKEGFILGACRQGICFVPVILVLPMIWGLNGILYAQPVADVLSAIITVFMAIHLHRELNEAEKQAAIAGTNEVH